MTILVAYTPDPKGEEAVNFAVTLSKAMGRKILVVNAASGIPQDDPTLATQERLDQVSKKLQSEEVEYEIEQRVRGNDAGEEVVEIANDPRNNITVVVVGGRKRSRVGKLFLGSTAQYIILGCTMPVVTVKAESS